METYTKQGPVLGYFNCFDSVDLQILSEIICEAESEAESETKITLVDVLRASSVILPKFGLNPDEDSFYYNCLLKMSLRRQKGWWKKLEIETRVRE